MRHQPWKFAETIRDGRCSIVHEAVKEVEEGNVGIGQLEKRKGKYKTVWETTVLSQRCIYS